MPRKRAQLAATLVGGLLLGLASFEIQTRIDDWARFGVPLVSKISSIGDLLVTDSLGAHARPNSRYRQFGINSLGFRGPELSADGRPLLVTAGASETFGLYEPEGKEWPAQLKDSLALLCKGPVDVANAAFAGMSLPRVRYDIQHRLRQLAPFAVVYYPTPMQYLDPELPPNEATAGPATGVKSHQQSRALPRVREAVKRIVPEVILDRLRVRQTEESRRFLEAKPLKKAPLERLARFEVDLRALVGDVRSIGAVPVLVVHQNRFSGPMSESEERWLRAWEKFYPRFTGRAILEFEALARLATRRVAGDSALILVDPAASLAESPSTAFSDFSHFTGRGSAIFGGHVARALDASVCPRVTSK